MASRPPDIPGGAGQLMALGMFGFGLASAAYSELQRKRDWRHASSERFGARPASQFVGPGVDAVTLNGVLVPEISGDVASLDRLAEMADSGDNWPLVDGRGDVWGNYRIVNFDIQHRTIMAGGIPRQIDFALDLERAD